MEHSATLPAEVMREFINHAFVECGIGHSTLLVLAKTLGFVQQYGIDIVDQYCMRAQQDAPQATIYWGDTREFLPVVLYKLNGPTTFWLDAHTKEDSPLKDELKFISGFRHLRGSVILIDDLRMIRSGTYWAKDYHTLEQASFSTFLSYIHAIFKNFDLHIGYRNRHANTTQHVDDIMVIQIQ